MGKLEAGPKKHYPCITVTFGRKLGDGSWTPGRKSARKAVITIIASCPGWIKSKSLVMGGWGGGGGGGGGGGIRAEAKRYFERV